MPRTARLFVKNACHHIITRGIRKEPVFYSNEDYERYLSLLHKYKIRYGCLLYSYCLMRNHTHLVIESPEGKKAMSAFMHGLNQSYAMTFNQNYDKVGHLWQNRYNSRVVLKDDYLINLLSYVEYNPVRASIVSRPEQYPWSSYKARVLGKKDILIDSIDKLL
jgi:putative transposase